MQTALHIKALIGQLHKNLVGGTITSTEFYKKERAAYLFVKNGKEKAALGFVYHPAGHGVFCVPPSKITVATREKPWPIFGLEGARIKSILFPSLDRIFMIEYELNSVIGYLAVEAIGPNGNLWNLDADQKIKATLRKRDYHQGARYEMNGFSGRIDPRELTEDQIQRWLGEPESGAIRNILEKKLIGFNKTLVRETMERAELPGESDLSANQVAVLLKTIQSLIQLFESQDVGYMYEIRGGLEAYPFKLRSQSSEPEKFKSLSMAILELVSRRQTAVEQRDEKNSTITAVEKLLKKLTKRITKLELDIESAADFEQYKKIGELIQINLASLKKGLEQAELEDLYTEPHGLILVKLDPSLTPNENAEEFFKRHRKGREGLSLLERRLEISREELKQWQSIHSELQDNFENASSRFSADLQSIMPRESDGAAPTVRLPYREHQLTTGLTIFIGRDGADNDRTTFEFAKPYELWFHTQQCPGSHVVMKFPHKSFKPSKIEIEQTAAIAAWHSKARNDSMVPVIYTERKYVRKPRKAKPGLVTVEREKSVMIHPSPE